MQALWNGAGVFASPKPYTSAPCSRRCMTSGVKSASDDTMANASGRWVCRISTASTASAMSLAFLPLVGSNCCTGRIALSCNASCHDFRPVFVQFPYARRMLVSPKADSSERMTSMRAARALSASMRSAMRAGESMPGPYAGRRPRRRTRPA